MICVCRANGRWACESYSEWRLNQSSARNPSDRLIGVWMFRMWMCVIRLWSIHQTPSSMHSLVYLPGRSEYKGSPIDVILPLRIVGALLAVSVSVLRYEPLVKNPSSISHAPEIGADKCYARCRRIVCFRQMWNFEYKIKFIIDNMLFAIGDFKSTYRH